MICLFILCRSGGSGISHTIGYLGWKIWHIPNWPGRRATGTSGRSTFGRLTVATVCLLSLLVVRVVYVPV